MEFFSISSLYLDRAYLSVCCYILKLEGIGGELNRTHFPYTMVCFFPLYFFSFFFSLEKKKVGNELGGGSCHCVEAIFFYYILYSLLALPCFFSFLVTLGCC